AFRKQGGANCLARLADSYLRCGRRDDVRPVLEHALAIARRYGERPDEAYSLLLLGRVSMRGEPADDLKAERYFREAIAINEELGRRPWLAHSHAELGNLYRRLGRCDEARAELTKAIDLFTATGMKYWLREHREALAALQTA